MAAAQGRKGLRPRVARGLALCFALGLAVLGWTGGATAGLVCAVVKIEIRQELTFERQAFEAHMRIDNALDRLAIERLRIDVLFKDAAGNPVEATSDPNSTTAAFFIRRSGMEGTAAIDGTGRLGPSSTADIRWLIVPAQGTGGTLPSGKVYFVGARLSYELGGQPEQMDVAPDFISVRPMPLLALDYFLTKDVFADDPTTRPIEPVEPFTLGLRVRNTGGGAARNVRIVSAQPEIVENEQGLLIDFRLTGSTVNDAPSTPSLLVNLGDIAPSAATTGRWIMETTLAGQFVDFTATFSHADELGGELTSLIDSVKTHFLVRDVRVDLPGRDAIRDFLALDDETLRVYESHGLDTEVTDQSDVSQITDLGGGKHAVSTPVTAGFMFVKLPDPYRGTKEVVRAYRSDGKELLAENVWFSKERDREADTWRYFFHLFDTNSTGSYGLTLANAAIRPVPPVMQFIPDRRTREGGRLGFIVEASDPNGTVPTISAAPLPAGATFLDETDSDLATYAFDWSPAIGQAGEYLITYTATDGVLSTQQEALIKVCPIYDPNCEGVTAADLPLGSLAETGYGWGYGSNQHKDGVSAVFQGDGTDRLLHVQGYDIDGADEVALYLNDALLGYLSVGPNDGLNEQSLWWLPGSLQVVGPNRVEFRQKSSGETWGVTRLGLFAPGAAFGYLDTLAGADQGHGAGFELHLPFSDQGYLLGITAYDADSGEEIALDLNGDPLVDLPAGANDAWGDAYQVLLPAEWLVAGDNRLVIANRLDVGETWGLRLDGLRAFGADLGELDWLPAAERHSDRVSLLIPPGSTASVLDYQCYDIDTEGELALRLDGIATGVCPPSGDNAWGTPQRLKLGADAPRVIAWDSTLNPPAADPWGLRLLAWLVDTDGDTVPDGGDNCPLDSNMSQTNTDGDGEGDACDRDDDNDGTPDGADAFPLDASEQRDTDGDGLGDNHADSDDDGDGFADDIDPDPLDASVVPAARVGTRSGTNPAFSLYLGATTQVTSFGLATDLPLIGDWDGDGLDNIGVYRPSNRRFYLDMNGNDVWDAGDRVTAPFGASGDLPIAGDWDGNRIDEIGVFRPSKAYFLLDYDDSGSWSTGDLRLGPFGLAGDVPIVGDWDGNGIDDLGVYRPAKSYFYRDMDGDGRWGVFDLGSGFGTVGDKPVIGDWNGDGIAEIGVYRPSVRGFYFDYDGNGRWNGVIDRFQTFGPAGALPFAGRW